MSLDHHCVLATSVGLPALRPGLELIVSSLELPAKVLHVPFLESTIVAGGMHLMFLFFSGLLFVF